MSSCNTGSITGRIVSDVAIRYPKDSRVSITEFRIQPDDAPEGASAIPVIAYNGVGEGIHKLRNQGDLVTLTTHVEYNTWRTEDGEPRGRHQIVVGYCHCHTLGKISARKRAEEQVLLQQQPKKVAKAPKEVATVS